VFYLRKKQPFGFYKKKKPKVKQKKTPNCHKTKTRMKEKKKSSKTMSHTTYSTHPIEAPQHTHTNSPKLHP
jgi:NADH:ubiquinone oxidoreductase subunit D